MNILFIGTTDILGGAAKVSWDIKSTLEKQGHKVSMFVADKRSDDPSVKVIPRQPWIKYLNFLLATDDFLKSDWILNTKEFKEADIVHCHNIHGRFFNLSTMQKMSLIKPTVWTLHDEWAITPHCAYTLEGMEMKNGLYVCPNISVPPRLLWDNTTYLTWRKKSIYNKMKVHIITPSIWLRDRVMKTPLCAQDVRLIPNGIDVEQFTMSNKNEARKSLGLPEHKKIILFLANDAKNNTWKGPEYAEEIIERFKDDPSVIMLSVGNLSSHSDTEKIIYHGKIEKKNELALYYSAADLLLFTSIAENFPLVILEAMSTGLPIVSFDVGGVKEVVEHGINGYIAPYKSIDGIMEGIRWVGNLSEKELERIRFESTEKIKKCYSSTHMIEKYISLYHEII
jgi:glycosyltransferase involved in cell wall biosynthesis